MHNPIESVRQLYKPDYIQNLIVCESVPSSGDFFYFGDCSFSTFTRRAFEKAFNINFISDKAFLDYFKGQGYFIEDLTQETLEHLKIENRNQTLEDSVFSLATRIQMYQPDVIIACPERIEEYVQEAIRISDIQCRFYSLPFPEKGRQDDFMERLISILTAS